MSAGKIRVLHCIHALGGGGAERQLNLLLRHSRDAGLEPAVFCVSLAGKNPQDIAAPLYQSSSAVKWNWSLWKDLARAVREYRPQVVHAWLPASMTIPTMFIARKHGVPSVFSFRSQMYFHRALSLPEWAVALLCSDRIASNTPLENCAPLFRFLYRRKRGVYIPNSVVSDDKVRKRSCSLADGEPVKILFVGRLAIEKNLDCLLHALSTLQDIPWRLVLCGRGREESHLRGLAATLGIESQIQWLGFQAEVAQIMAVHDVLVLPSWREGAPNAALEAMAVGLPCVMSRVPGNVALFKGTPVAEFFDPASPSALAAALRRVITNQDLRIEMTSRATACVKELQPDKIARAYASFYREMVECPS